jgi:hypothetical protein
MRRRHHHIIAVGLPGLVLLPTLFLSIQLIRQQWVRHQMKAQLESAALRQFTIAEKDLQWVEAGKELYIDHKLFDVKTIMYKDGLVHLSGLFDAEEEKILEQLGNSKNTFSETLLISALQLLLFPADHTDQSNVMRIVTPAHQSYMHWQAAKPADTLSPVATPPPDTLTA